MGNKKIIISTEVQAPVEKVWNFWTQPEHVIHWNHASEDWHCPKANNDLKVSGKFSYTMAAKDGSMSFDFEGVYDAIDLYKQIVYTILDGRQVEVLFVSNGNSTVVTEAFEPENMNPEEMQRAGWQSILDNFKNYVEET